MMRFPAGVTNMVVSEVMMEGLEGKRRGRVVGRSGEETANCWGRRLKIVMLLISRKEFRSISKIRFRNPRVFF